MASCLALSPFFFAKILFCLALHGPSSLFPSVATRDSSRASSIQCSATFSYALLMDGSVACAARCLASSAFRRQASLSDDIRGGSSNAPNQAASRCVGSSGHDRRAQRVVAKSRARRNNSHGGSGRLLLRQIRLCQERPRRNGAKLTGV